MIEIPLHCIVASSFASFLSKSPPCLECFHFWSCPCMSDGNWLSIDYSFSSLSVLFQSSFNPLSIPFQSSFSPISVTVLLQFPFNLLGSRNCQFRGQGSLMEILLIVFWYWALVALHSCSKLPPCLEWFHFWSCPVSERWWLMVYWWLATSLFFFSPHYTHPLSFLIVVDGIFLGEAWKWPCKLIEIKKIFQLETTNNV